jgi:hypothetical protein
MSAGSSFRANLTYRWAETFIVVFDLGLGQGSLAAAAPVDRFFAAKQAAVQGELAALPGDGGLVAVIHGQVWIVPLTHHAQTFEFVTLDIDKLFGVSPARATNLGLGHLFLFGAQFFVHIVLDGQSVAVPTGNVNGVETGHLPGADDNILEDFVQAVPIWM